MSMNYRNDRLDGNKPEQLPKRADRSKQRSLKEQKDAESRGENPDISERALEEAGLLDEAPPNGWTTDEEEKNENK